MYTVIYHKLQVNYERNIMSYLIIYLFSLYFLMQLCSAFSSSSFIMVMRGWSTAHPSTPKKLILQIFYGFLSSKNCNFFIQNKKMKRSDEWHQGRRSVAGVAGVAAAPGVVEAPLGAAMVAAARAASRAAARAAAFSGCHKIKISTMSKACRKNL